MRVTEYESSDGNRFATVSEMRQYELSIKWKRLVGLSETEVEAVVNRTNDGLAGAIEYLGYCIGRDRRASGKFKHMSKKARAGKEGAD